MVTIDRSSGLYQLNDMTIGIAGQDSAPEPERAVGQLDRRREKSRKLSAAEQRGGGVDIRHYDGGLPVHQIVGPLVRRIGAAVAWE